MISKEEDSVTVINLAKDKNVLYMSAAVCVFSFLLACFLSVVVALIVLASYSAGLLVPYFIFRDGHHLPNLLVIFLSSDSDSANCGSERRELRRSCSVCGGEQCSRQLPTTLASPIPGPHHPHIHITMPRCVDDALEELLTLVLDEHVYSWYREFSVHDQLADEIRHIIRYAVCVATARLDQVDLTRVITERLLPSLLSHLDQYVEGGRRVRGPAGGLEVGVLGYCEAAGWRHPALESRQAESEYLRALVTALKPFLLPQKYQTSSVADSFLKELLGRFLLLQLMDYLADPDTVNMLLLLLLSPDHFNEQQQKQDQEQQQQHLEERQQQQLQDSGAGAEAAGIGGLTRDLEPVLLLKNFASVNTHPRTSCVRSNLSAVLKDQTLLYLFHTFLKEEGAINILQFCLAVEDFNRHILDPELSPGELQQLHSEALDLYHGYMAAGAADRLSFPAHVVSQLRDMVHSDASSIVKLRTTRPLFQAYEHAYNLLEREYLPHFLNSHMYFAHLCGPRSSQACQKTSSRHRRTDSSSSATFSPFKSRVSKLQDISACTVHMQQLSSCSAAHSSAAFAASESIKNSAANFSSSSSRKHVHSRIMSSAAAKASVYERTYSFPDGESVRGGGVSRGVVERVGSVRRSLKTLGAQMTFKPQVVAGDEFVSAGRVSVAASVVTAGGEYMLEEPGEDAVVAMQDDCSPSPRGDRRGRGLGGLASGSYRDLSAWRVTIPRLDYVPDPASPTKMTHFFVIDVTRIDVAGGDDCEEMHWEVLRRFHEFYILESKLTEFHGEFQYNTLPSRRSLFASSHASDFMMTRRQIFEEYLQKLLQTPALRKSQLLFLFLKSKDEFTSSFLPDVSLARLLRDVPRKLVKERGQHLEPFIGGVLASAGGGRTESLEEATEACESLASSEGELHPLLSPLYGDNAASLPPLLHHSLPHPPSPAPFTGAGITEMIMFVAVRVYGVSVAAVRWLVALRGVAGSTIDAALLWLLRRRIAGAITPHRAVRILHLLRDALVGPSLDRPPPLRRRRELRLRAAFLGLLPPWLTRLLVDDDTYREAANTVVSLFQHPLLNKQLSYVLLDQVLEELFPELGYASAATSSSSTKVAPKSTTSSVDVKAKTRASRLQTSS